MTMSNDTTIELTGKVTGRIEIRPNGKDTVFVDGNAGSLNGNDDNEHVHFFRVQGSDYIYSGNWQRNEAGEWVPHGSMSGADQVRRRGSGPYDRAPISRATTVLNVIASMLPVWFDLHDGQAKMNAAELRDAQIRMDQAERDLSDARAAFDRAVDYRLHCLARLASAQDAVAAS